MAGEQAEQWAARSQAEDLPPTEPEEVPRRLLGEFELLSVLGRGGMGIVYRAWQPSLGRQVALKCLLRSGDPKTEARFTREIHSLGRVEHPHLVKIFTSGAEADQWFYTMELVEGATLGAVCGQLQGRGSSASELDLETWQASLGTAYQAARASERPLRPSEAEVPTPGRSPGDSGPAPAAPPAVGGRDFVRHVVELVRQVAEASHALHEAGIIHRDIKPDNILVSPDGTQAVLMDLGLAQLADETEGRLTRTRQFVGTLRYASPEQVSSHPLDRRSDVYSLGATLWELLTLRPLFGATDQTPTHELERKVQSTDPEPPRRFNVRVPEDLEAIVLKCLEKDCDRRYATAADLAADLARWLRGEPVLAQPPSLRYLLGKSLRRHRVGITLIAVLVLTVLLGTTTALTMAALLRIDHARREAMRARDIADRASKAEKEARNEVALALQRIKDLEQKNRQQLVQLVLNNGFQLENKGDTYGALAWFADALRLDQGDPIREEMHRIRLATTIRPLPKLIRVCLLDSAIRFAQFSPDGQRLITADARNTAQVWDAETGQPITPPLEHNNTVRHASFSPDGRRVVTASDDRTARVWDATTGQPVTPPLRHEGGVAWAMFSPDGRRIVTASDDGTARVWDATTGQPVTPLLKHENGGVVQAAFSPDGSRVITADSLRAYKPGGSSCLVCKHGDTDYSLLKS